ncbi:NB-ARC domain-containing protein [Nonomuraea wenchangensis]|uniref:ATP-binding protein n=1 Tax=Nonomuraea wenchangensis TaxID=568860 RepID=UPI00341D2E2F
MRPGYGKLRQVGNLPPELTNLVGRRAELTLVRQACARSPLVTLTGVGGVGKTRLALRVAADLQSGHADGAWFVELSALDQGILLPHTIAEALPVADRSTRAMTEVLAEYLAGRRLLLVLDTCEHLADSVAAIVRTLLDAAPGLTVLATSRRPLGLPEEQVLVIEPLPVPEPGGGGPQDAVLLLAERTATAVPGFAVTDANRADVVRLCRRLEGLPLAIELAAARLRELPVSELCDLLEDRFAALEDSEPAGPAGDEQAGAGDGAAAGPGGGGAPPWHRALRTAIGWSHQLCAPGERLLWARASVFSGSFDDEAVTRICADDRLPAGDVPALLDALVAKSVLTWAPTGGGERYRMLDTIREYGALWLRDLGEQEHLRARHRDFYLSLARRGDAAWFGPDQISWNDRTTAEHDNLRAALEHSLAEPGDHAAVELAAALWFFWYPCGLLKEGQHYLERALRLDVTPSRMRNRALWVCALTRVVQGDAAGGLAWATECDEAAGLLGDGEAAVAARAMIMAAAVLRGDLGLATALAEAMLAVHRPEEGLTLPALLAWLTLSHVHVSAGRPEDALRTLEEMSAACDRHGERWMRAYADLFRGMAELELGHADRAQEHARVALGVKHRLHDNLGVALALDVLSRAAAASGQGEHAARLLGMGRRLWREIGQAQLGISPWVAARDAAERQARAAVGEDAFRAAYLAGSGTSLDAGVVYALSPAPRS